MIKLKNKRILSIIMMVFTIISTFYMGGYHTFSIETDPVEAENPNAATGFSLDEETSRRYDGDGYYVDFTIDNKWESGYNATVTITNTTDEKIENWSLVMPLNNEFSNIWNGVVADTFDDFYVIKNAGWNQDIPGMGSVSFGLTSYETFAGFPEYYSIIGKKVKTKTTDYSVEYIITGAWDEGLIGQITITNLRDTIIEDWRLNFQYEGKIVEMWDGKVMAHIDNLYEISCEDYNQNIYVGQQVTLGFKAECDPEINVPRDFILREYTNNNYGKYIALMGFIYNDQRNGNEELQLYYTCSEVCDKYELYVSENGVDYEVCRQLDNVQMIEYPLADSLYFYVVGFFGNRSIKSDTVCIRKEAENYIVTNPDADGDQLCDYLEYVLGSDVDIEDTDGDGLGDFYEVYFTITNPTLIDSDGNGINDPDEDLDMDELSNIEEYQYGTYPFSDDTDRDGLSDYDEVYTYHTDPLMYDSDDDTLADGEEIALELNPLKKDTDEDDIFDPDEYIQQYSEFAISENDKPLFNKVSVDINCKGLLENHIKYEDMYNYDLKSSEVVGLLSAPMEIYVDTEFEEATITFYYDSSLLGDTKEENLAMIWYDRDNDDYVLLDSMVDTENHTVSYKTNHFSMYLIVDKEIWLDCWREDINYRSSDNVTYYDIVFTVDVSGSMSGNRLNLAKQSLNTFIDALMDDDRAGIVSFNSVANTELRLTYGTSENKNKFVNVINNLRAGGGTDANAGLMNAMSLFPEKDTNEKMIILVCDGDVRVQANTIAIALENDIVINCINVASGSAQEMQNIAYSTGGTYYYAATTQDLIDKMSELQNDTIGSLDITDSDGDGLYDVYEINGMRLSNGQIVYADANKMDTDGDGVSDFDELGGVSSKKQVYIDGDLYSCTVFHNKSKPGTYDSDNDGIPDVVDIYPLVFDLIEVVELENKNFLEVYDANGTVKYGGNQNWSNNPTIQRCGCGLTSMVDTELYLSLNNRNCPVVKNSIPTINGVVAHSYYNTYTNKQSINRYIVHDYGQYGINGVYPWDMKNGLQDFYEANNLDYYVFWGKSSNRKVVEWQIYDDLSNNIPVPASYDNTFAISISVGPNNQINYSQGALTFYSDKGIISAVSQLKQTSHYFTITGIYKRYNSTTETYDVYYHISSWGEEYYISSEEYMEALNYFSNILYTDIH